MTEEKTKSPAAESAPRRGFSIAVSQGEPFSIQNMLLCFSLRNEAET